ncbi:MAG: hypothetical protein H6712_27515 [Myxococcales bacterium]|nr:hypothetical protein [Myxococcales bacterium]MCB9717627.1 hypothetical protein [Myxococcales bacterium]
MCCFSQPVELVAATKIFARPTGTGTQVLAYEMRFAAVGELSMVLPLPVPPGSAEDAVRFVDLSGYSDFFADLAKGFPVELDLPRGGPAPSRMAQPNLVVHEVGEFEASFVPTLADFERLDPRFRLPPGVWDSLPAYADYGFAVFELRGAVSRVGRLLGRRTKPRTVHPMAFELPSRAPERAFFPTVHVHDGRVHPSADFDHTLYLQGLDAPAGWDRSEGPAEAFVDLERAQGLVRPGEPCSRRTMVGRFANEDVWV